MSLIFLIGMPAVGKTYWGRLWAEAHEFTFVDLDEEIEKENGLSVPEIFETSGEPQFRKIESDVLRGVIGTAKGNVVIACGGGTPVFSNNISVMKESGCVVWLDADLEILMRQLEKSPLIRPLLSEENPMDTLRSLYVQRKPFYEQSHMKLDVTTLSGDTFAEILKTCTSRQL
jgi:shikimate kinase